MIGLRYRQDGEVRTITRELEALRLQSGALLMLEPGARDWQELAYYDGAKRCWCTLAGDAAVEAFEIRAEPELLLELTDDANATLTQTKRTGLLKLTRTEQNQLCHLLAVDEQGAEETLAVRFSTGVWDTTGPWSTGDGWPERASGDILIRQGLDTYSLWNGDVGARVRLSALAERQGAIFLL